VLGFFRIWAISIHERETNAYLGAFEPSQKLGRDELHEMGFSDERITWLSKPHIPEWKIIAAEKKCADAAQMAGLDLTPQLTMLRDSCFVRIKNEPLFCLDQKY